MSEQITLSPEQLQALIAEAVKKGKEKDNGDFQGVWRREGHDYGSSIVTTPDGTKVWLNIFPNRYWKKRKGKKGEQPMFNVTLNPYTPKQEK